MTRFSAPSPLPMAGAAVGGAAVAGPGVACAAVVDAVVGAVVAVVAVAPGPQADATSATTAAAIPSLRWNMFPPLQPASRVIPGRGGRAVASIPVARVAPARPAP